MRRANSFKEIFRLVNNYFKFVTGLEVKPLKKIFFIALPFSVLLPIIVVYLAALAGLANDGLATSIVVLMAALNIIPWILFAYVAIMGYAPFIPFTLFSEFIPKFKEINASPENMRKIKVYFADIVAWLLFAYIYIVLLRIWHTLPYFPLLILFILFFIASFGGGWITPDPKFKQKLWRLVFYTFLVVTIIIVTKPRLFYWTGIFPHELSYPYKKSVKQLESLEKVLREKMDEQKAAKLNRMITKIKHDSTLSKEESDSLKNVKKELKGKTNTNKVGLVVKGVWKKISDQFNKKSKPEKVEEKKSSVPSDSGQTILKQNNVEMAGKIVNLCPQWKTVSSNEEVALVYIPCGLKSDYMIQVTGGEIKLKTSSGGYDIISTQDIRTAKAIGESSTVRAYYYSGSPMVKIQIL